MPSWSLCPLLHAFVFFLTAVLARLLMVRLRTGATPLALGDPESARGFTALCFYVWLPLADAVFVLSYAIGGEAGPALWSDRLLVEAGRWTGVGLLAAALVWVTLAQAAMGKDWKMGIADGGTGRLHTEGPFAWSRHPVYAGIRLTMLGQLLVIGSWPMLGLWTVSELLVRLQARFEEEAMAERHGARYREYCARVRRWL